MALLFVFTLVGTLSAQSIVDPPRNVTVLSIGFSGDAKSSQALTNLFRLQVSATFREAETDTRGRMVWSDEPVIPSSHEEAVARGRNLTAAAPLVLWGDAYSLQDGIALQSYVSVTDLYFYRFGPDGLPPGVWIVSVPTGEDTDRKIALGLPRNLFRLPLVVYRPEATDPYPKLDGLPIYDSVEFQREIGRTGVLYRAHEYRSNAVLLSSNSIRGWVRLDYLSEENNVSVKFVGALFRITRGDYLGAEGLLQDVISSSLDLEMEVNTMLLLGLCAELKGKSGLEYFTKAAALAPIDATVARYLLAGLITHAERSGFEGDSVQALSNAVEGSRMLFDSKSQWFGAVTDYASEIEAVVP